MTEIPTAEELIETQQSAAPETPPAFRMGRVSGTFTNGTARVVFDGEDIASGKQYAYLAGYMPNNGDRVLLASVAGTYIVMGKVGYDESPEPPEQGTTFPTINVTGNATMGGDLDIDDNLSVGGSFRSSGNVGFYNTTPVTRRQVQTATADTQTRTRLNELITRLSETGLIRIV